MLLRQILVAYDGSPPSRRAVDFAAELAGPFRSSVTLLHAIQMPETPPEAAITAWADLLAAREDAGQALIEEALQGLRQRNLKVDSRVVVGPAAEQLAKAATDASVDLVVAGTTGKSAVARVFLGSVTTRLLHISPKPVLVVP